MTVKELILSLSRLDEDLEVWTIDDGCEYKVRSVDFVKFEDGQEGVQVN